MVDVTQASNLLMSLGVSQSTASKAATRASQDGSAQDAQTFLGNLQKALSNLAHDSDQTSPKTSSTSTLSVAATTTTNTTKPTILAAGSTTKSEAATSDVKPPFGSFEEFKHWESNLGSTFSAKYEVPDYIRAMGLSLAGGEQDAFKRYTFFKNNPAFAVDYESIRNGGLSKFPTDGSTLVKSDLSTMPTRIADYYKENVDQLLAAEGFNMDPTLARMRMEGTVNVPTDGNTTEWLMSNRWTEQGIVAQNNRLHYANADYIGIDGKGAGTYKLAKWDLATGNLVGADGERFDGTTGKVIT